jgi:hypothetical protein
MATLQDLYGVARRLTVDMRGGLVRGFPGSTPRCVERACLL